MGSDTIGVAVIGGGMPAGVPPFVTPKTSAPT